MHLSPNCLAGGQRDRLEIFWQLSNLGNLRLWSQQEIPVSLVQLRQRTDDISGISPNPKFIDPANIDGDLHERDLSI
jgi:hypothetical protein